MQIALPTARYDTSQKKQAFWADLVQRVSALPGVLDVSVVRALPTTITDNVAIQIAGQPRQALNARPVVDWQSITPEYFRTLHIPLILGREFTSQDREGAPGVAIINEAFARRFWPAYPQGLSPIGQHILAGRKETPFEIVGIVADVRQDGLASRINPEAYLPFAQLPPQTAYLAVRTASASRNFSNAVLSQVTAIDSVQSVSRVQTMTELLNTYLVRPRVTLILLGSFAVVAVLVTLVGIYGVIAFLVVEKTQEFAIRQALGARPRDILKLVVGRGPRLLLAGLAIGMVGAAALTRVMKGVLFQVSATDPWTLAGTSALFLAVGLAACYLPARRATRLDPSAALR